MDDTTCRSSTDKCMLDELSFRLRSIEVVKGGALCQLKQQLVFSYALIVMTSGEVQLVLDHQQCELDRNSVYVCMPGQTFGTIALSEEMELYVLYFDVFRHEINHVSYMAVSKDEQLFPYKGKISVYPPDKLPSMCEELYRRWQGRTSTGSFRCQIDFQEILFYINKNCRTKPENAYSALEYVKQYMEEHYTDSLTIDQLAQVAEISPKYFVDLFKKKYGISAMEYVAELRLQQAKRLMAQSDARLRDIAHQVGYADEFYFSRKFKKEIGVSPNVYMKSRRRKLVAYSPSHIGYLLPLNIMPYAAPLHPKWTEYYYREYRNDIPVHISAYRQNQNWQANIELLTQIPADVIIANDDLHDTEKQALEKIAPVFYLSVSQMEWRQQFRLLADFFGESWQAEKWLDEYDRKLQTVREQLQPGMEKETVVIVRLLQQNMFVHSNRGIAGILYDELQFRPTCVSELVNNHKPISIEELKALNADRLFMMIRQESETLANWEKIQNKPQWQTISAVQQNKIHMLTSDPWLEYSPHAHLRMLDHITQLIAVNRP
ncbi:ABC transporter substrate-binding protein [Brevibacillus laterosporus]|nr:ABC transporter substrate-binding protein [Brevibacillus laterosporus]MED1665839.1 ABC transporter substrate-binding protein [Brevibacillus laterosporus]MED1671193.1 ABC transporter substrate-binding protein [Brevibacillus laterosporus]MED1717142.1 ABC transporter substrate-binding protein [Brevibacillus laterosporus]